MKEDFFTIGDIGLAHKIKITSRDGKSRTLDFDGSKLKIYGDLEYDEASEVFFKSLDGYFQDAIEKQVRKRLNEKTTK